MQFVEAVIGIEDNREYYGITRTLMVFIPPFKEAL